MEGAIELLGQFLEAVGVERPALAIPRPVGLPHGVEGEPHPPRSSLLASPVSVSCTFLESTRIVFTAPLRLRNVSTLTGGMPVGALSSASHS